MSPEGRIAEPRLDVPFSVLLVPYCAGLPGARVVCGVRPYRRIDVIALASAALASEKSGIVIPRKYVQRRDRDALARADRRDDLHDGTPFIAFKTNATGRGGRLWVKMFHHFSLRREELPWVYAARNSAMRVFSTVPRKPQMVRWEYLTIDLAYLPARTDDIDLLNEAGAQGWELIAILSNYIAYLRRHVSSPADAPADRATHRRRHGVG